MPFTAPFVLLDDSRSRGRSDAGLLFSSPKAVLQCTRLEDVAATIAEIPKAQQRGHYLAGWISYECGIPGHPTLKNARARISEEPLIWLGVFGKPRVLSSAELARLFEFPGRMEAPPPRTAPGESRARFNHALGAIKRHIEAGDVYQINHTFRLELEAEGPPLLLYAALRRAQPVPFGALIDTGAWTVLSLSPELFLARRGDVLVSRPMKGTAPAGRTLRETAANRKALARDEKNRAENLMITDLIRNDLSRVSKAGSVGVRDLFKVEKFGSVLQMTSEVRGNLRDKITFAEIFPALFPCGSVTGAPKVRAMEIIAATEMAPRGVYTGALGLFAPNGDFTLNVPIRTAVLKPGGKGWFGVGSGIVADSTTRGEYRECLLKAEFLKARPPSFSLLETMLWTPRRGFTYLDLHLKRLLDSARYFDFDVDRAKVARALRGAAGHFPRTGAQRVRLLCAPDGSITVESARYRRGALKPPVLIGLSRARVDSQNPMLFHKTTARGIYEEAFPPGKRQAGLFDVLLLNEHGRVTEGTFTTLFAGRSRKTLITPPLSEGLLPGVLREALIEAGRAKEAPLDLQTLKTARYLYVGNSVTGLLRAKLAGSDTR